jgi:hypothetical protein
MAIAIATSPALETSFSPTNAISTSPFSPAAGTLLVAAFDGFALSTFSISNSGTARTWTQRVDVADSAQIRFWTAPNPTALSNITVTVTGADQIFGAVKVWVVTGADLTTPTGATGTGTSTTNNINPNVYTSTVAGSRGFAAAMEQNTGGTPSSTDDAEAFLIGSAGGLTATKAANTATAGATVTFNFDASGTGTAQWDWAALEVLPAVDAVRPVHATLVGQAVKRSSIW